MDGRCRFFHSMKILLSITILAALAVVLLIPVEATFMQFVRIRSETRSYPSFLITTSLSISMLIDGKPNEIAGSSSCSELHCTPVEKFCSKDGIICAKVFERCRSNAGIQIYYAHACRYFLLKDYSYCRRESANTVGV